MMTKKRIEAGKPKLSPMIPKIMGEIAPGMDPTEKRSPKARPLDCLGHTSVWYAVFGGTPK